MTDRTSIDEPLVLIGTGRCGSTLLHRILARHPDVAYLTPICVRWPGMPQRNHLAMGAIGVVPALQRAPVARGWLRPSEAYPFWEHHCPGFARPRRDLTAADLDPRCAARAREALARTPTRRRSHLILKITGWPRVGYLDALFDHARFVHIRRDGRAVANSFLRMPWWGGQEGPERWRYGSLSTEQEARWNAADRSLVALAALTWELLMDAFQSARTSVPAERYLDVTYEDLCSRPVDVVRRVSGFAGLRWTDRFERTVEAFEIHEGNEAWLRQLGADDRRTLLDTIEPALARHGYA